MQMMDELPMVYAMLVWLYIWIENEHKLPKRSYLPFFLVAYGLFWTFVHSYLKFTTIFQVACQTCLHACVLLVRVCACRCMCVRVCVHVW